MTPRSDRLEKAKAAFAHWLFKFSGALVCALLSLAAVGPQQTEVMLLKFADHPEEPCDPAFADSLVHEYSGWLLSESRGAEWLTFAAGVQGWWTLPHDLSYYNPSQGIIYWGPLSADIDALAQQHGRPPHYTRNLTVYYFNTFPIASGDAGIIWSYCPRTELYDFYILKHEGGHAQILPHANSWSCSDADVGEDYVNLYRQVTPTCKWDEYGDVYDPMGMPDASAGVTNRHYSLVYQSDLGWRAEENIQTVMASTTVALARADATTTEVQEIQIPLPGPGQRGYFYSVEYWVDNGVLVRLRVPNGDTRFVSLVNGVHPITATDPFVDPYRGVRIEVAGQGLASASVRVTLAKNFQEFVCLEKAHAPVFKALNGAVWEAWAQSDGVGCVDMSALPVPTVGSAWWVKE